MLEKIFIFFERVVSMCVCFLRGKGGLFFGLSLFIGVIFFSFSNPNLPQFLKQSMDRPDFMFEKVTFLNHRSGELNWAFIADFASVYKRDQVLKLSAIDGEFYHDQQSVLRVTSPKGVFNFDTSMLFLDLAEVMYEVDGQAVTLNAKTLKWDPDLRLLEGRGEVTVLSAFVEVSGDYFVVDVENRKLKLSENSRASIRRTL